MIVCKCKNEIKKLVVVAYPPLSTQNHENHPLVISDGLHFVCEDCAGKFISSWKDHNNGRVEPYLIEKIGINVRAETKKDFARRVLPQIINQFKVIAPYNWYIPKTDISNSLKNNLKKIKL
ncbi:MAG: hypothetical protein WC310_04435 [Patescibacteria group bacterium]|jgi:hypothetical protein